MKQIALAFLSIFLFSGFTPREGLFIDVTAVNGELSVAQHVFSEVDVLGTCAGGPCTMNLSANMFDPYNHNSGAVLVIAERYNSNNVLLSTNTLTFNLGSYGTSASLSDYYLYANVGDKYKIILHSYVPVCGCGSSAYNGIVLNATLSQI